MILKMEVYFDGQFWCARGIGEDIFTQGKTLDEVVKNIKEAVALHFEGQPQLPSVLILPEVSLEDAKAATG